MNPSRLACFAGLLSLAACADLGERELGVCGNGVVEPSFEETCDGDDGCIEAGEPFECQYSCADDELACPEGSACGLDGVCRAPAFAFEPASLDGTRPVPWVEVADLDGDGRAELLWVESEQTILPDTRTAALHVTRFDGNRDTSTWSIEDEASIPALDDIDDDGLTDLVLGLRDTDNPGAFALRNEGDGTFSPLHVVTDVQARPAVHGMTRSEERYPLLHGAANLSYRDESGERVVAENAPALAFTDAAIALPPPVEADPVGNPAPFAFAYISGPRQETDSFLGPVRIRCIRGTEIEEKVLADPASGSSRGLRPWLALAQVDGRGPLDLIVATKGIPQSNSMLDPTSFWVAYGYAGYTESPSGTGGPDPCPSFYDVPNDGTQDIPQDGVAGFATLEPLFNDSFEDPIVGTRILDLDQDGQPDLLHVAADLDEPRGFYERVAARVHRASRGRGHRRGRLGGHHPPVRGRQHRGASAPSLGSGSLRSGLDSVAGSAPPSPRRRLRLRRRSRSGGGDRGVSHRSVRRSALFVRWGAERDAGFVPIVRGHSSSTWSRRRPRRPRAAARWGNCSWRSASPPPKRRTPRSVCFGCETSATT